MDLELTPTRTESPDDTEIDTPPHTLAQPITSLSFTNGATKNHHHFHHQPPPPLVPVTYKECMKNHAATRGGTAVDGCGEFMPSDSANPCDPTSLKCAACGCHRNFHRREPTAITPPFLDFRHPPPPSPPPPYGSSVLLALCNAVAAEDHHHHHHQAPMTPTAENPAGRKRFRTKFSQEQKEKMRSFSENLGWKMQRCDEAAAEEFCREIGVTKGVLKVWMHNNKNTFGRKEISNGHGRMISFENNGVKNHEEEKNIGNGVPFPISNNGSTSSN